MLNYMDFQAILEHDLICRGAGEALNCPCYINVKKVANEQDEPVISNGVFQVGSR